MKFIHLIHGIVNKNLLGGGNLNRIRVSHSFAFLCLLLFTLLLQSCLTLNLYKRHTSEAENSIDSPHSQFESDELPESPSPPDPSPEPPPECCSAETGGNVAGDSGEYEPGDCTKCIPPPNDTSEIDCNQTECPASEKVDKLSSLVEEMKERMGNLATQEELADLRADLFVRIDSSVEGLTGKIENEVNGLNEGMAELKGGMAGLQQEMTDLKGGVAGLNVGMTELNAGMTGLKQEMAGLKQGMTNLENELTTLKWLASILLSIMVIAPTGYFLVRME